MTTAQIIVTCIFFVLDFKISVIYNVVKLNRHDLAICQFVRMLFLYMIIIAISIISNDNYDKAKGKCPEYKQVTEKFYKLKE